MQDLKPDYLSNASQRTPCVLVLDASMSMDGEAIKQLNEGLKALEFSLKEDITARMRVQLSIVRVGGPGTPEGACLLQNWTDAADFEAFDLATDGLTPLGAGMKMALNLIEEQKNQYRENSIDFTRPWIFLITDGMPTDENWQQVAKDCKQAEADKKCMIFPIGVNNADTELLSLFSATLPKKIAGLKFIELFQWLSASLGSASRSAPGETVQVAPIDAWAAIEG